jgi:hypothetical protein
MADVEGRMFRAVPWLILGPVLASVLLHFVFLKKYLSTHAHDLGILVCVDERLAGRPPWEAIHRGFGTGYDGSSYYAIARAPWRVEEQRLAPRHLRILYPLLCWLCGLGGYPQRLLWVMPAVNLAAVGGLAGVGAWLALRRGLSPWWGLLLPVAVTAGLPVLRDLTDPVSTLAVAGLVAAVLGGASAWAVLAWTTAAVFCREQNVAVAGLLAGVFLWQRRPGLAAGVAAVLGLWVGWVVLLRAAYGTWPFLSSQGHFGRPLAGFLAAGNHLHVWTPSKWEWYVRAAILLHVYLLFVLAVPALWRWGDNVGRSVTLLGLLLAVTAGPAIWDDVWSFGRVLVWLPLGIWFQALQSRFRWLLLLLAPGPLLTMAGAAWGLV